MSEMLYNPEILKKLLLKDLLYRKQLFTYLKVKMSEAHGCLYNDNNVTIVFTLFNKDYEIKTNFKDNKYLTYDKTVFYFSYFPGAVDPVKQEYEVHGEEWRFDFKGTAVKIKLLNGDHDDKDIKSKAFINLLDEKYWRQEMYNETLSYKDKKPLKKFESIMTITDLNNPDNIITKEQIIKDNQELYDNLLNIEKLRYKNKK